MKKIQIIVFIIFLLMHSMLHAETTLGKELGENEYINNCSDCHGNEGKGNGPKAAQLGTTPSDLTLLSKKNGGSFPETAVYNIIDGRRVSDYHGQEMPIWGDRFLAIEDDESVVEERINNLLLYLESIQVE